MLAYIPAPWILWDETIENAEADSIGGLRGIIPCQSSDRLGFMEKPWCQSNWQPESVGLYVDLIPETHILTEFMFVFLVPHPIQC